jgi:WD40 repeat protein
VRDIFLSHKLLNANVAHVIRCDQHQKVLDFFCEDENKLCCSTCAIVHHSKCHSVVEVEKIAGKMTSPSSNLEEKLLGAKENAEGIKRDIITSKYQIAQNVQEMQAIIREMRDEVMKMFDELEVAVVKRAKSFQKETLLNLEKKQSQIEKHLAKVTAYLETVQIIYKNGTPTQKFIAEQKMESEVNAVCRNVNEECQNSQTVTISFDFDEKLTLPPRSINEYVPGQLTLIYPQQENVNGVNKVMTLTPGSSIDLKKTEGHTKEPLYTGINFLHDGRLVAVDNRNNTFLVYNEELEKVGSYQLSYSPQFVVAVSEDEVAITSTNEYIIDFLRVSKANEICSSRKFEASMPYNSICLKDDSHFVVGTIDYNVPVRILSFTGEEFVFGINFPNCAYIMARSICTYIRSADKVVLANIDDKTVYIYDIKTNTRVVVKDDRLQQPSGLAIGPSDTILVCTTGTNSIVQISQTGQILSSHKIDMETPSRVCVSLDQSILVVTNACRGTKKLQTFKISS